jgi:hypothetical protein
MGAHKPTVGVYIKGGQHFGLIILNNEVARLFLLVFVSSLLMQYVFHTLFFRSCCNNNWQKRIHFLKAEDE